ncbi:hypothetical protein AYI68_g1620 [Smittium mucronatum]|uniref:Uncharacterized protein n=1 Tax=Smittium mucronatum TaxID=133383 RepID=A0A1R0GLK3_9FUNG|nr:hypothetical protein AYI68_g8207 [Smittium mucronatum]OLY84222.1 hypothetical protein AYI68_g1620 [Smittium mucronatum]
MNKLCFKNPYIRLDSIATTPFLDEIILETGHSDSEDCDSRERHLETGVTDILVQPIGIPVHKSSDENHTDLRV